MEARRLGTPTWLAAFFLLLSLPARTFADGIPVRELPDEQSLARYNLVRSWHTQIPVLRTREKVSSMLVHEGTVVREGKKLRDAILFVETNHGQIHCLDADTGRPRWTASIGIEGDRTYPPAITDNYIYAVSGTKLVRLERSTGRVLITRDLPGFASSGPAANEKYIFVPITGGMLYAFSVPDEKVEGVGVASMQRYLPDPVENGKRYVVTIPPGQTRRFNKFPIAWRYAQNSELSNPPVVLKTTVAIATGDGTVYSFNQENGSVAYRHINGFPVVAPLALLGRELYMASSDFGLYAIDLKNGSMKWRFAAGYPIHQQPAPFVEDVFVVPDGGGLTCMENQSGELRWTNDAVVRLITVSKDFVYGADRFDNVMALSRKTGGLIGALALPLFTVSPENQYNDRIYLSTTDGLVACLYEKGSPLPLVHPQTSFGPEEEVAPRALSKAGGAAVKKKSEEDGEEKPKPKPKPRVKAEKKPPKDKDSGGKKKPGKKGDADP